MSGMPWYVALLSTIIDVTRLTIWPLVLCFVVYRVWR